MQQAPFFFTVPSRLGRRLSMVDPLGFRALATHYLHRLAPGFTGRVRNRIWFPVLCWGAMIIEEDEVRNRRSADEEPRTLVRNRRAALANLERAMRVAAMLEDRLDERGAWRYGNRSRWWATHRKAEQGEVPRYRSVANPPFFSSRSAELANNALGCLRRSLERLALFVPSEGRLRGGGIEVLASERYCLTDRGRRLAQAFEADLKRAKIELSPLKEWGLFPDRLGKGFKNESRRAAGLGKIAKALPIADDGAFDVERFPSAWSTMDELFRDPIDPLSKMGSKSGPIASVIRAHLAKPEAHPLDALAHEPERGDFWDRRRVAARAAAAALMGRPAAARPLFEVIGAHFVDAMQRAFPDRKLDCPRYEADYARITPADAGEFERARDRYRAAWDRLRDLEAGGSEMNEAPLVEASMGSGVEHFHRWLEATTTLTLDSLLELHEGLPRFASATVIPLVERDAGQAFLESAFPWNSVETPASALIHEHEADLTDTQDSLADEDDNEEIDEQANSGGGPNRYVITDYWWAAKVAGDVILGRQR